MVMKKIVKYSRKIKLLFFPKKQRIEINWVQKGKQSWLSSQFITPCITPNRNSYSKKIERIALETNERGDQPLWEGYGSQSRGPTRLPNNVRIERSLGDFFSMLAQLRRPEIIVEFGAAFGVSGMYWLAGLEANKKGKLLSFEVNEIWADIAKGNLNKISQRFSLCVGTFEENIDKTLGQKTIDLAFIDAIHTREFVVPHLELS